MPSTRLRTLGTAGVYCLANRGVELWFEAWARSFRRFNPDLPALVIPFDGHVGRVRRICDRFGIGMVRSAEAARFEELGRAHYPSQAIAARTYRKLYAFFGVFEHFLFLDADVLVLDELSSLLSRFAVSGLDVGYFDTDLDQVYVPGALRESMAVERGAVGINTGSFLGRRDCLSEARLQESSAFFLRNRAQFRRLYEQPFLSHCLESSGLRVAAAASVAPWIGATWVGDEKLRMPEGLGSSVPSTAAQEVRAPFVHFAGTELKFRMPHAETFLAFAPLRVRLILLLRQLANGVRRRLKRQGAVAPPAPGRAGRRG